MDQIGIESLKISYFVSLFDRFKTGNMMLDAMLSSALMGLVSYMMQTFIQQIKINKFNIFKTMNNYYHAKNNIRLEGRRMLSQGNYWSSYNTPAYSENFRAIWDFIMQHMILHKQIYNIKEIVSNYKNFNDDSQQEDNIFVVDQYNSFVIDKEKDIHAQCTISNEVSDGERNKMSHEIITIDIYSYSKSVAYIKEYVDDIRKAYLINIKKTREDNKYIYTLIKDSYKESKYEVWDECKFESTRTFDNMYFDDKEIVLKKINFFIENKKWYHDNGIPYTLGLGLYGPPGTGKTSLIKAIANFFPERHLVVISFKIIKTKEQLESFFFEDRYCSNNASKSIDFSKKIIVFEDIDCASDIVLARNKSSASSSNSIDHANLNAQLRSMDIPTYTQVVDEYVRIAPTISSTKTAQSTTTAIPTVVNTTTNTNKITLDDILNLWDGLRETSGRIIVMSSNHYDKLDPALIRPGRIDITIKMDLVSRKMLNDMFHHYYKKYIPPNKLSKIKEKQLSPADITNIFIFNSDNPDAFLEMVTEQSNKNSSKSKT